MGALADHAPAIARAIEQEPERQRRNIVLIASENYASKAVMEAQGSALTNKYAEGYPGRRYYGSCEYVDIAAQLAEEVWVVAPEHDQSGVGQGISLHTPLRVYHHGERRFAVSGTPADCVMFAMAEWFEDDAPDLVLSGVNCGANLSDSVMYSGTVGAVLAAAHLGLPGIALSQAFVDRAAIDYAPTTRYAAGLIRELWEAGADRDHGHGAARQPLHPADRRRHRRAAPGARHRWPRADLPLAVVRAPSVQHRPPAVRRGRPARRAHFGDAAAAHPLRRRAGRRMLRAG